MTIKYTALIVDDSKPISFFNKIILERSGYFSDVKTSENGREALIELKTEFSPDIIFLDINMPIMNGWQFLDEYTNSNLYSHPIFLLLGAEQSAKDKEKLTHYPIVKGVRTKMLSLEVITEIINNILVD